MTPEMVHKLELGINIADQLDYSVELVVAVQAMTGLIRQEYGGMQSQFLSSGNPFISHPAYNSMAGNTRPRTYRDHLMVSLDAANREINADIGTLGGIPVQLEQPSSRSRSVLFSRLVRFDLNRPGYLFWNVRGERPEHEYRTPPEAIDEIRRTYANVLVSANGNHPVQRPD